MADIASIVDDAMAAGLDPRRLAFTSVYMRFAERGPWEGAASVAGATWEVAAYSTAQGHMLRLSRRAHPTARDLAKLRDDALAFARTHAADWLSLSIENLQQAPNTWAGMTVHEEIRLPEPRAALDAETDMPVREVQHGGTA